MKTLKLTLTALAITASLGAQAGGFKHVNDDGTYFNIGGDVEMNVDYNRLDTDRGSQGVNNTNNGNNDANIRGRILVDFSGGQNLDNDRYVAFKAQPMVSMEGGLWVDDSWVAFGDRGVWDLRLGRSEAYDMFPVGLDIFLEHSGNTNDFMVQSNQAYIYRLNEGRGRGGWAGQAIYNHFFGNTRIEVGTMVGDRADLFAEVGGARKYHNQVVTKEHNSFIIRPVIEQRMGDFRIAASLERNLVTDAILDDKGNDVSERNGYGFTGTYQVEGLIVNANVAYLDAFEENDTSIGANVDYHGMGLGYIHAINDFDSTTGYYNGKITVDTVYAAYVMDNVLKIPSLRVALGAYWSGLTEYGQGSADFADRDDIGGRVRVNYFFW